MRAVGRVARNATPRPTVARTPNLRAADTRLAHARRVRRVVDQLQVLVVDSVAEERFEVAARVAVGGGSDAEARAHVERVRATHRVLLRLTQQRRLRLLQHETKQLN